MFCKQPRKKNSSHTAGTSAKTRRLTIKLPPPETLTRFSIVCSESSPLWRNVCSKDWNAPPQCQASFHCFNTSLNGMHNNITTAPTKPKSHLFEGKSRFKNLLGRS